MVIPTVPPELPFWQDLSLCDYFFTSLKIAGADICMVVGDGNSRKRTSSFRVKPCPSLKWRLIPSIAISCGWTKFLVGDDYIPVIVDIILILPVVTNWDHLRYVNPARSGDSLIRCHHRAGEWIQHGKSSIHIIRQLDIYHNRAIFLRYVHRWSFGCWSMDANSWTRWANPGSLSWLWEGNITS